MYICNHIVIQINCDDGGIKLLSLFIITPYKGVRCKVFPSYVSIFLESSKTDQFRDGSWIIIVRSFDLSCQDLRGLRIRFTNWPLKIYLCLKFLLLFVQNRKYGSRVLFTQEAENLLKTLSENPQTFLKLLNWIDAFIMLTLNIRNAC